MPTTRRSTARPTAAAASATSPTTRSGRCVLKTGHGVKTSLKMPTLREALAVCKDRIAVNIDQGYEYYDLALAITEELGVTDQVLIKGKRPVETVSAKFAEYGHNMMYMPIIDILKPQGRELFEEYASKGRRPAGLRSVLGRLYAPSRSLHAAGSSQAVRNCGSIRSGTRSAAV